MCLEYVPELFIDITFKYQIPDTSGHVFDTTYKDAIWFFLQGLLGLVCMIFIFLLIPVNYKALKIISIASISWWGIEFYQKLCWLAKINDSRLYVSDSARWQITLILFLVLLAIYGLIKYKS